MFRSMFMLLSSKEQKRITLITMVPLKHLTSHTHNIKFRMTCYAISYRGQIFFKQTGIKSSKSEWHLYLTAVCVWTSYISLCGLVFNCKWVTFRLTWLLIFVKKTYLNCTQSNIRHSTIYFFIFFNLLYIYIFFFWMSFNLFNLWMLVLNVGKIHVIRGFVEKSPKSHAFLSEFTLLLKVKDISL